MSIEVARGTISRIVRQRDGFVIQVQRASDPVATEEALRQVLANLEVDFAEGPSLQAGVFSAPAGPFVLIDGGDTPERLLRKLPEIVAGYLQRAGVEDAVITSPPQHSGPLFTLVNETRLPSVSLVLYPPSPRLWPGEKGLVPPGWLEEARAWVATGLDDEAEVLAEVEGVEFTLSVSTLVSWWQTCQRTEVIHSCAVGQDAEGIIRGASGFFLEQTEALGFAVGRREAGSAELLILFEQLRALARRLAPAVGYGYISFDSGLSAALTSGFHFTHWWEATGRRAKASYGPGAAAFLSDEIVFDTFAYQILGPGHLARLGGPPPGSTPLEGGRVELALGDPAQWLPTSGEFVHIREKSRHVIAPCLLEHDEMSELRSRRRAAAVSSATEAPGPG